MISSWEPTGWWRVVYADGRVYPADHWLEGLPQIWWETSDEDEARAAVKTCPSGGIVQRLDKRTERKWREA